MEIVKIIITILGYILLAVSAILLFDAREITEKWFSFGDRNDAVKTMKIVGFALFVIGGVIIILAK